MGDAFSKSFNISIRFELVYQLVSLPFILRFIDELSQP